MSAKHAVLGLLIERPGYGYDLARRLRERFGSSGFAPTGVYSALDQLTGEGMVRSSGTPAGGAPSERGAPRMIYEATQAGREQFDQWMQAGSSPANVRDELNMKLALSRPCDLPALIELARGQEQECFARLEALKRGDLGSNAGGGSARRTQAGAMAWSQVASLLVRDAEARQLQSRIEWLQRARAIMTKLAGPVAVAQPTGRADAAQSRPTAGARVA